MPTASGGPSIQLGSYTIDDRGPDKANHAFVLRGDGERAERLLKVDLPCPYSPDGDLKKLVERAELLSRRDFPGVLAKLGVKGKPNAIKADAKLPAGVEEQPSQLGLTWVLAAVRSLHEAIRADGESPARLGVLARSYALLGVLSEFQWHPAHKAFKARALLYAERLVARDPKGDWPLWNRAYVRAMVGMHGDAHADLKAAARAGRPSSQPAWADLIQGLAQQDETKLGPGPGVSPKLAALLRMLVMEFPYGTQPSLEAARDVVDLDPECFRACDAMCQASGVSNLHVATTLGPEALGQTLTKSLKSMPGLPTSVRDFLARPVGGDAALYRLLEKSGAPANDPGEPSWSVMGHLLRETRFVHVFRRLHFMRMVWGVPIDEYWSESRASVAGHRFYPALEILADNSADRFRPQTRFLDQVTKLELEPVETPMISFLHQSGNKEAMKGRWTAERHADHIARDLAQMVEGERDTIKLMLAGTLLRVSPDNALALATMIELDKDSSAKMAEWEKKAGDSQPLLAALAAHSTREKKYDQTERYLTRYIQIHPDFWGYYTLAANYKAKGDLKRWQAMLEKSLTVEDRGLQHARAQGELAYYFMDQGQWAKAKPYAEAAGETWANWGMDCALRCADGMKDWDRAVLWAQRRTVRYPSGPDTLFVWYLMCMRTGRGDLAAARRFTDEHLRTHGGLAGLTPAIRCYYQWLNGDLKGALKSRLESYRQMPNMGDCQIVLALAELVGDKATTDEYRKLLVTEYRNNGPKNARIGELLPGTLKGGKSRPPDMKAVDEVLATIPAERRPAAEFWVGLYLKAHGQFNRGSSLSRACVVVEGAFRVAPLHRRAGAARPPLRVWKGRRLPRAGSPCPGSHAVLPAGRRRGRQFAESAGRAAAVSRTSHSRRPWPPAWTDSRIRRLRTRRPSRSRPSRSRPRPSRPPPRRPPRPARARRPGRRSCGTAPAARRRRGDGGRGTGRP